MSATHPDENDDDEAPPSTPLARIALTKAAAPRDDDGMVTAVRARRSIRPGTPGAPVHRVLLVVRDALVRASLARDLVVAGSEVRSVAPGDIATCKDAEVDVVLVEAPEREVRATVSTIRRWFPRTPMIVRTDAATTGPISTREGVRQEVVARNASMDELMHLLDRLRDGG